MEQLAAALSDGLFSKSDLIVGLGGGVAMDLAAMTAMLYYRGTRHAFIPTTLTAAIAAAIGGKIGIDGNGVKNLLGGFRQPVGVYVDTKILSELKRSVFMQGMAEAVKYAFVGDKKLFARLVEGQFDLEDMVARCIRLKYEFVKGDEDETGKSLLLGFGNTFGNAVERLSDFTLSHGECVGIGMVISAKISENLFCRRVWRRRWNKRSRSTGSPSNATIPRKRSTRRFSPIKSARATTSGWCLRTGSAGRS